MHERRDHRRRHSLSPRRHIFSRTGVAMKARKAVFYAAELGTRLSRASSRFWPTRRRIPGGRSSLPTAFAPCGGADPSTPSSSRASGTTRGRAWDSSRRPWSSHWRASTWRTSSGPTCGVWISRVPETPSRAGGLHPSSSMTPTNNLRDRRHHEGPRRWEWRAGSPGRHRGATMVTPRPRFPAPPPLNPVIGTLAAHSSSSPLLPPQRMR